MSFASVFTRAQLGVESPEVRVEVHLSGGLPSLSLVGMPEAAVRESKDRVRSALLTCDYEFPSKRITIYPKTAGGLIWRLRWAFWRHPGRFPPSHWNIMNFWANWH